MKTTTTIKTIIFITILLCTGVKSVNAGVTQTGDHSCGMPCYSCHSLKGSGVNPSPLTPKEREEYRTRRISINEMKNPNIACAAIAGDIETVKMLIKMGADVNYKGSGSGINALGSATFKGFIEIVKILIKAGADVNITNKNGGFPLMAAADHNYVGIAKILIKEGADLNMTSAVGGTPLMRAVDNGHADMVRLLIDSGAHLDTASKYNATALSKAKRKGVREIIKMLEDAGAREFLPDTTTPQPLEYPPFSLPKKTD